MLGGAEVDSWNYLAVCVPIVVLFAPFGSFMSSHFHRQVLASLIYVLDTIALVKLFFYEQIEFRILRALLNQRALIIAGVLAGSELTKQLKLL